MRSFTVTTLVENTAGRWRNTLGEWGLAILIDTPEGSILWDTGQGNALLPNAEALQVDLNRVSKVALSHGHYDHTGGLYSLLKSIGGREVYAGEGLFSSHCLKEREGFSFIGVPFSQLELEEAGARFHFSSEPLQLLPGVWMSGKIPRQSSFEPPEPQFYLNTPQGMQPDLLLDDRALFLETSNGLAVVLGCAHSGFINTLEYIASFTGVREIFAVVGGTHLMAADENRIERTLEALKKYKVQQIGVSHCTGFKAAMALAQEYGSRFFVNQAGTVLNW